MIQKICSMSFLHIGRISGTSVLLFISSLLGCGSTDCGFNSEFVFVNNTNYIVTLPDEHEIQSNDAIAIQLSGVGDCEDFEPEKIRPPYLDGTILFNGSMCWTLDSGTGPGLGEGPAGIANYDYEKLGSGKFRFTYTFSEEDILQAEECSE